MLARDGTRAVSHGSTGYLWDASGVRRRFAEQRWLWSGAFSPDGGLLLTGSEQRLVLRDGHSGEALAALVGHQGRGMSVATSPDGRAALAGDRAGQVAIWRIRG